jgi:hypothetical protein
MYVVLSTSFVLVDQQRALEHRRVTPLEILRCVDSGSQRECSVSNGSPT